MTGFFEGPDTDVPPEYAPATGSSQPEGPDTDLPPEYDPQEQYFRAWLAIELKDLGLLGATADSLETYILSDTILNSNAFGVAYWASYVRKLLSNGYNGITSTQSLQKTLLPAVTDLLYYLGVTTIYHGVSSPGAATGPLYGQPLSRFAEEDPHGFPAEVARAYASVVRKAPPPPPQVPIERRWRAWSSGFGGYNRTSGESGGPALTVRAYGGTVGAEYRLSRETALGFALGGSGGTWGGSGTGRSDVFQYGVYGRTRSGPAYLAAGSTAAPTGRQPTAWPAATA